MCLGPSLAGQAPDWPSYQAPYLIQPEKVAGAEMTDIYWSHLHQGMPGYDSVTWGVPIIDYLSVPQDPGQFTGNQLRYLVHDVAVSPWIDFTTPLPGHKPMEFTIVASAAVLDALPDGWHAVTIDVQGPLRNKFKFRPLYLHLSRGRTPSTIVPIFDRDCTTGYGCVYNWPANDFGRPGVVYIDANQSNGVYSGSNFRDAQRAIIPTGSTPTPVGYPVDPSVTPWHTPPYETDLYQELMAPHAAWPDSVAKWWAAPCGEPATDGKYVRAFPSKRGEVHTGMFDFRGLGGVTSPDQYGESGHRSDPYHDGQRGPAWTSTYITGQIDSTGGLVFVEIGGSLRYMKPDGEVITVVGWRTDPAKDAIWIDKPLTIIRQNQELRGVWLNGQYPDFETTVPAGCDPVKARQVNYGFHEPLDVTIDARNENVWYVAGYLDNCIWKVVVDKTTWVGTVSVLAGSLTHVAGFSDGLGTSARFNSPISLTFSPTDNLIYVSDEQNHAVRVVNPDTGATTTLAGSPGEGARLLAAGAPLSTGGPPNYDWSDGCFQDAGQPMECFATFSNRQYAKFETTPGNTPDIYVPQAIRVDSKGRLVLMDMGFSSIRRIDPKTKETTYLGTLNNDRFDRFLIGWAWLDVDRWGNSGPLDEIYWVFTTSGGVVDGESPDDRHINTLFAVLPSEGGRSRWVTGTDNMWNPDGWGARANTTIPHYPWMVAVDPRGGVLLTGLGTAGITRLRVRKPTDPVPASMSDYNLGRALWQHPSINGGVSPSLKFGWQGHGQVGFADLWGMAGKSDDELLTIFEIPDSIKNDPEQRRLILNYMRLNI